MLSLFRFSFPFPSSITKNANRLDYFNTCVASKCDKADKKMIYIAPIRLSFYSMSFPLIVRYTESEFKLLNLI